MTAVDLVKCELHETLRCSICRARAGFRPGQDRYENDCTVRSFVRLTGAEYHEAAEILRDRGFRPGRHGTPVDGLLDALGSVGYTARPYSGTITDARADGGTFLAVGYRGRKGHAWTITAGASEGAGRYESPGTRYRLWRIS